MAITVPRLAYHLLENRSSRDRSEGSVTSISGIRLYNTNNKGAEKTPVTTINLRPPSSRPLHSTGFTAKFSAQRTTPALKNHQPL